MRLDRNLGHAPALPAPVDPVQLEIERALSEGEQFVASRYVRILKALSKKAEGGDKGAAEILLKCVIAPKREEIETRKIEQPSGPPPIAMRIAQARIQFNISGATSGKPSVQVTDAELAELPADRKEY